MEGRETAGPSTAPRFGRDAKHVKINKVTASPTASRGRQDDDSVGGTKNILNEGGSSAVVSHSSPKAGLTPISCPAVLERSASAPFIKERRMECINATSLHRKSGQWGTQRSLVRRRILLQIAVDACRRRCRLGCRLPGRCPRNRCRCWLGLPGWHD